MKIMKMRLQLTLAIIKPDISIYPFRLRFVRHLLLKNDFLIVRSRKMHLDVNEAEMFYQIHKDKFFYNRLVTYMSSGICYAHILAREDAIGAWRRLMGPTKVSRLKMKMSG
uniref:Nucleoside diphosphate kinase-like domain-containing protein n=1 Tax=Strigamia maritima TaxID=126957 RepID=T1JFH3_STRMM